MVATFSLYATNSPLKSSRGVTFKLPGIDGKEKKSDKQHRCNTKGENLFSSAYHKAGLLFVIKQTAGLPNFGNPAIAFLHAICSLFYFTVLRFLLINRTPIMPPEASARSAKGSTFVLSPVCGIVVSPFWF